MIYIIDLTYVLKILFILALQGSVTSRDIALALEVYNRSMYSNYVHFKSCAAFRASSVMLSGGHDAVVDKIEVLTRQFNITDEEVSRLWPQIHAASGSSRKDSPITKTVVDDQGLLVVVCTIVCMTPCSDKYPIAP